MEVEGLVTIEATGGDPSSSDQPLIQPNVEELEPMKMEQEEVEDSGKCPNPNQKADKC